MMNRMFAVVLAVLCLSVVVATAEWQRTVTAFDTRTPAEGKLQGDIGAVYADGENWEATMAYLTARYGIADNWSVSLSPSFVSVDAERGDSESGIGDTDVSTIYRFMDESSDSLDMAAGASVSLPTGDDDKGLGSGSVDPTLGVAMAKTLGPVIAVGNLGYTFITDADEGEEDGFASAALEAVFPMQDNISLNAFLDAQTAEWEDADEEISAGVGARYLPQENMLLRGSIAAGLTDDAPDVVAAISFGYEF